RFGCSIEAARIELFSYSESVDRGLPCSFCLRSRLVSRFIRPRVGEVSPADAPTEYGFSNQEYIPHRGARTWGQESPRSHTNARDPRPRLSTLAPRHSPLDTR